MNNNYSTIVALLPALVAVPGLAQGVDDGRASVLEEVIVTAQKRESSLQETPISISTFDPANLDRLRVAEAGDVAKYTPNLDMRKPPGSYDNYGYSLRGMSSTDPSLLTEPTVGLYADGVYIARISGAAFDTVELERIEVLRGPQGTLYGRNAIGGAINLVTRKPLDDFGFKQKLSAGNYDYFRSETTVDTGEYAGFSATLSYTHWNREGWLDNLLADNMLGEVDKSNSARVAIRWEPTDTFTADFVYDYTDRLSNGSLPQLVWVRPYQAGLGGPIYAQAMEFASPDRLDGLPMAVSTKPDTWSEIDGYALTLAWNVGGVTLKSISAYRDWYAGTTGNEYGAFPSDGVNVLDGTGGVIPAGQYVSLFSATREDEQDQFTQEFQLLGEAFEERLTYTLGLYYFEEETYEDNPQTFVFPAIMAYGGLDQATQSFLCRDPTFADPAACLGKDTVLSTPIFQYGSDNDSWAVYGQFGYDLSDKLAMTLGLRYTRDNKSAFLRNSGIQRNEGIEQVEADDSWSNFTPALTLDYAFSEDLNGYATVSQGFRSGGFNARASTSSGFSTPFDEENVTSFELGLKADLLDQRLRVNSALFYYEYKDKQVTQFEAGSNGASSIIANSGKQDAVGVELELAFIPAEGWLLQASYGFIDIDIKEFETTPSDPVTGLPAGSQNVDIADFAKVIHTPEHNGSVILEYAAPPFSFGQLVFQVDASYNSTRYFHPVNNLYDTAGHQTLVNGKISLNDIELGPGALEAVAWVRNLTDEEYREWGIDFGALGFAVDSFIAPRMYGVDLVYQF
ncbi:TonB-dependent receptor [Parahaliea mediterranea]|uniref:TonB-dependent receptor n=1 Tax=Parahaliea mediterranea TaxID=651086 RepID=UPI000E2F8A75|nr:TonB-dependent receptor [Parahaliea mediterranea]